ncbi:MAG: hypothetical protein HY700_18885 [Gemmatimonadetes bacterium]|nr:hypothetical protein [Gemmatimonadota bacterium]
MKHQAAILLLWVIAIVTTFFVVGEMRALTTLGPVYAVCMIGSVITVRAATRKAI